MRENVMKPCEYACQTEEHQISRRLFLGAAAGLAGFTAPSVAKELSSGQKRMLVIFLSGGVSQLETWDPKPNTDTGGPFRAIPTSVPGIHISELLPQAAKRMHLLTLVRGINTAEDEHGRGATIMLTGRRTEAGIKYPEVGAVASNLLVSPNRDLPGHVQITPGGGSGFNKEDAGFLGPKFASITLADGKPPADLLRPASISSDSDREREALRQKLNAQFAQSRRSAQTDAYTESFEQAAKVAARAGAFDAGREDPKAADRYGRHDFGRHMLLARRLLEQGVTYVKVTHTNYDTHHENFDFHIEQLSEFDRPFSMLLDDLADRGLLQSTLVVVMSEFGRTPRINDRYGRDHWSKAWSVAMAGCGLKAGAVIGKTNANGTAVTEREVHGGHLFHTYFKALGLNPTKNFYPDGRPIPIADPKAAAISEILT